jgi:membrane protease YdiL (CAAX protease family)
VATDEGRVPHSPRQTGEAGEWQVPWTLLDVVVVFLLGAVLAEALRRALAALLPADAGFLAAAIAGGVGLVVAVVGWIQLRHQGTVRRLAGPGPITARVWWMGLVHGLVAFVVINLGGAALFTFVAEAIGADLPPLQESLRETITDPALALVGLVYTMSVAVVAEELFFRGLLFQVLRARAGRWLAIGASGALFGIVHQQPDPVAWMYAFIVMSVFGMYLAWAFDRYRHVLVPLLMHAAFNGLAVAAILRAS